MELFPTLPADEPRCLAHGDPAGWCDRRDECLRHLAIRRDKFDGSHVVKPRVCDAGNNMFIEDNATNEVPDE